MVGRLALVALACLMMLPPAAGQGINQLSDALEIDGAASPPPIAPDTGSAELVFPHRLLCDWNRPLLVAAGSVVVHHEITADHPDVIITGSLSKPVPTDGCADPTTRAIAFDVPFSAQLTSDAPGEVPVRVTLISTVNTPQGDAEPVEATTNVMARYLGLIRVNVPSSIKQTVDGAATFELTVTNLGNSRSAIHVESDHPGVVAPPMFILESAAQGGVDTEKTVPVTVRFSGGGETTVQLTLTPVSTKDPSHAGQPEVVHLLVRDGSLLGKVESPGPALPLALGALAWLARRRR